MLSCSKNDFYATILNSIETIKLRIYKKNELLVDLNLKEQSLEIKLFDNIAAIRTMKSIIIYNIEQLKITHNIEYKCNDFEIHGDLIYVLGKDLLSINLLTNKRKTILKLKQEFKRICLNCDEKLIAISNTKIMVLNLDGKIITNHGGHSSEIIDLKFMGKHILSLASDDRFIQLWSQDQKAFITNTPATKIQCNEKFIMAYLEDGKITIFNTTGEKGLIELNSTTSEAVFIDCILDDDQIVGIYGNVFNPTFEHIDILDKNGNLRDHYVLTRIVNHQEIMGPKVL